MTTQAIDMTGKSHGNLHVMGRAWDVGRARGAKWNVICVLCKHEFWTLGNRLRTHIQNGTTLKCMGCGE